MNNRKGTTKSQGAKHTADKFYTHPVIAQTCLQLLPISYSEYDVIIEPSAGNGSFSSLIPKCLAFDLHPEHEDIIEQDWLAYNGERFTDKKILVIGNPPFGQQNSLAVKFINHAAGFADTIAFILPLSFKKDSIQNRLNPNLHLIFEYILPKDSFLLNGEKYHVPCVFQVWEYREDEKRIKTPKTIPAGYRFVKREDGAHFSVQRIGGRAGSATKDWEKRNSQSNYFIRLDGIIDETMINKVVDDFNKVSFPTRHYSVGPRSISKEDIIKELNRILR